MPQPRLRSAPPAARREAVFARLRAAVIEGILPPGAPIGESETAALMGVSRTPVREALLQLEREGLVLSKKDHGFRVSPLSVRELEELFALLGWLERFALERSHFRRSEVAELRRLNRGLGRLGTDVAQRVRLDAELHARLTSGCDNARLQEELGRLRGAARRYEFIYGQPATLERSVAEHARILARVEARDMQAAGRLLELHSLESIESLRGMVERQQRGLERA